MIDISLIVAGINLVVGIVIVFLATSAAKKLRGKTLYWAAILFMFTGITYAIHAAVEVLGFGEGLYAMTALVAAIFLSNTLLIIDVTSSRPGRNHE